MTRLYPFGLLALSLLAGCNGNSESGNASPTAATAGTDLRGMTISQTAPPTFRRSATPSPRTPGAPVTPATCATPTVPSPITSTTATIS